MWRTLILKRVQDQSSIPFEGVLHHITPPVRPSDPENRWAIDNQVLQDFYLSINRMSSAFIIKEFPPKSLYQGTALIHTSILYQNGFRTIKARFKSPTPADAYIRFLYEELNDGTHE